MSERHKEKEYIRSCILSEEKLHLGEEDFQDVTGTVGL